MDTSRNLSGSPTETFEILGRSSLSSRARILALPSELLFYLSRFLDLAGLIVFSTATCRALRNTFAQFDRELLFLEPAHRLNLSEWRDAARQIHDFGLTRSSCIQRSAAKASVNDKGDVDLLVAVHQLSRDESLIDFHLLQCVLEFLTSQHVYHLDKGAPLQSFQDLPARNAEVHQIRSLHLTGWHGIAGAFLIQQLRSQPSLRDVCTIVKTERADSRIWQQAATDDRGVLGPKNTADRERYSQHGYVAALWHNRTRSRQDAMGQESSLVFKECEATQIIVQVGKRRPRRADQPFLRGEGLQIGYQGYCVDMATTTADMGTDVMEPISFTCAKAVIDPDVGACNGLVDSDAFDGYHRQGATRKRLHVILQGREVEDAKQNEEMFERSMVSCNRCKERVVF